MQRAMAAGQRIFEVTDVAVEVEDAADAEEPAGIDGAVEFQGVTFGYVPGHPVLRAVRFRVAPGEPVALVGPTGSGQTSTTERAQRLPQCWAGTALVGGRA